MTDPKGMSIAQHELLQDVYDNLIEAGLLLAVVDYDKFLNAALTGFNEELDI